MLRQGVVAENRTSIGGLAQLHALADGVENVELTDLKRVLVSFGQQVFVSLNLEFEWVQSG
jgi:hypothetical protein